MMALRRLSMRAPTGVRQMSGHSIEEAIRACQPAPPLPTHPAPHPAPPEPFGTAEETAKWKKVSYVFIGGVVIPFTTFSVIKHFAHHQFRS